jgi:peptide/nickel transport system substrate-binding protein
MLDPHVGLNRRELLRRGAQGVGGLALASSPGLLAACGSNSGQSVSGPVGTLRMAQADTPPVLDGDQAFSLFAEEVQANVYGGDILRYRVVDDPAAGVRISDILGVGPKSGIAPGLAESFTASADLRTFEFKLRKDAKSFYGNPLTAEDIRWSWERRRALKGNGLFLAQVIQLEHPESVQVIDEHTVRFQTPKPSPILLKTDAAAYYGGVFDSVEVKKHTTKSDPWAKDWLGKNSAGFGPYHVESYRKGQSLTFVANPGYYGPAPRFKKVVWRVVASSSDRLALLKRGDVDVSPVLAPRELQSLLGNKDVKVFDYVSNRIKGIKPNHKVKPFNDPKVRQAMAYAMPTEAILKDAYFNTATQMKSPLPKVIPGYTEEFWKYDTDEAKAKQLLTEAGLPNGFDMELIYDVSVPEDELVGTIIRTAYQRVGINVTLKGVPASVYGEQLFSGKGDAYIGANWPFVADPGYHLYLFWRTGIFLNTVGYSNKKFDAAVDQLLTERDDAKRIALARDAQRIWLEDMPWILINNPGFHLAHRADVEGLVWFSDNNLRYELLKRA